MTLFFTSDEEQVVEFEPRMYLGSYAPGHLSDSLQNDLNKHKMSYIENDVKMIWDEKAQKKFDATTHCHIFENELKPLVLHAHRNGEEEGNSEICVRNLNQTQIRNQDHYTGIFRNSSITIAISYTE